MKQFKTTLWTLLVLLLVFGCQRDEQETLPQMAQRGTRMVSADDIPLVMTSLSERLNLRAGDTQTANTGQVQTGLGAIDLEQIFEVIDTLDNANYTFLVDDEDEDIFTFTNLIVKKREDGSIDPPYLLRYTVDSLHRDEFLQSGLSMEHFTGMISKRFLTNFSSQQESSANPGGEYDANTTEPCDYDSRATGGGGEIGWTDPFPPADGGPTGGGFIRCEFVTLAEEVTTCYRSDIGDGPRCTTVTQYVTKTHCYWVGPSQDVYDGTNCPDPETEEVGVITHGPREIFSKMMELLNKSPDILIDIPCDQLIKWVELGSYKLPEKVKEKLRTIQSYQEDWWWEDWTTVDWAIHSIEDAKGTVVNMDYFPVKVLRLPAGMTAEELLKEVRLNINEFINTGLAEFEPHPDLIQYGERDLWRSDDPLSAVIFIDIKIPPDPGNVITSSVDSDHWIFSTLKGPLAINHPVSGNRKFGFSSNSDGTYTFFTRGLDRITKSRDAFLRDFLNNGYDLEAMEGADALWASFQNRLAQWINDRGGRAEIMTPINERPDWEKLKNVLLGLEPISSYTDCN